jgi:hypothetical protein
MQNCAYCGRENTDDATRCRECGTPIKDQPGNLPASDLPASGNPARTLAQKRMIFGALWFMGGMLVTLFTYLTAASSPSGGTYVVAWGAIVFGALQFVRGLRGKDIPPTSEDLGYMELAYATRLETEGHVPEALSAYQRVAEKYPATAAGDDARKSMESLRARLG